MTQVSFAFPSLLPYIWFQVPFHLLLLPSWQNHKVDMAIVGCQELVGGVGGCWRMKRKLKG
jgi:hypothetical protein